jgi:hypothetical protein
MCIVNTNLGAGLLLGSKRRTSGGSDVGKFKKRVLLRAYTTLDVRSYSGCSVFIDSAVGIGKDALNRALAQSGSSNELFNGDSVGVANLNNSIRQSNHLLLCIGICIKGRHMMRRV